MAEAAPIKVSRAQAPGVLGSLVAPRQLKRRRDGRLVVKAPCPDGEIKHWTTTYLIET